MNVLLIEDPYVAAIVDQLDDKLDCILKEILEEEAWSIFDNDEDYNPEFEEEWDYPFNPLVTQPKRYSSEVIGKVKYKGTIYFVLFEYANLGANYGISGFTTCDKMASASAQTSFLGCASKEIAEHFGKYFGVLITEAKFGDFKDFSVISYNKTKSDE